MPTRAMRPHSLLVLLLASSTCLPALAKSRFAGGGFLKPAPQGFTAPPDMLMQGPPAPPPLPEVDVGEVNGIEDVCRVCTKESYQADCYKSYTTRCLSAMRKYVRDVLKVQDRYCSCYSTVFNQLSIMCPSIDNRLLYSSNCDRYCYYGPSCPVSTVLHAILKPGYTALANKITGPGAHYIEPAKRGQVAATVELRVNRKKETRVCYTVYADSSLPKPMSKAVIRFGFLGQRGMTVQSLFRGNKDKGLTSRTSCVPSSGATLLSIGHNPGKFFLSVETPEGGVRGQLLPSLDLVAHATARGAGVPCTESKGKSGKTNTTCAAIIDVSITSTSLRYAITYLPDDMGSVEGAYLQERVPKKGGESLKWPPMVSLFGPNIREPSKVNGMGLTEDKAMSLMTGRWAINITSSKYSGGALLGKIRDSLTLDARLTANQVVQGSRTKGSAYFRAQVGAGGICYSFSFQGGLKLKSPFAYIQRADKGDMGPYIIRSSLFARDGKAACVSVDPALTGAILGNPEGYYVQLYEGKNKPRLRSQLRVADVQDI